MSSSRATAQEDMVDLIQSGLEFAEGASEGSDRGLCTPFLLGSIGAFLMCFALGGVEAVYRMNAEGFHSGSSYFFTIFLGPAAFLGAAFFLSSFVAYWVRRDAAGPLRVGQEGALVLSPLAAVVCDLAFFLGGVAGIVMVVMGLAGTDEACFLAPVFALLPLSMGMGSRSSWLARAGAIVVIVLGCLGVGVLFFYGLNPDASARDLPWSMLPTRAAALASVLPVGVLSLVSLLVLSGAPLRAVARGDKAMAIVALVVFVAIGAAYGVAFEATQGFFSQFVAGGIVDAVRRGAVGLIVNAVLAAWLLPYLLLGVFGCVASSELDGGLLGKDEGIE